MTRSRPECTHRDTTRQHNTLVTFGLGTFPIMVVLIGGSAAWGQVDRYALDNDPGEFVAADLNHDGATDLAIATDGGVTVFLNEGDGTLAAPSTFGLPAYYIVAGDVDGDHDIDLVTQAGQLGDTYFRVYLNNGDGDFAAPVSWSTDSRASAIALVDIDGDKDLDYVHYAVNHYILIYANNGAGSFSFLHEEWLSTDKTYDMATGDLDGDGDVDLVAGSAWIDYGKYYTTADVKLHVFMNQGDGTSWTQDYYTVPPLGSDDRGPFIVKTADLNGDSRRDILTYSEGYNGQHGEYAINMMLNDGNGNWHWGTPSHDDKRQLFSAAVGDLDGDGTLDLVVGVDTWSAISLLMYANAGDASFRERSIETGTQDSAHHTQIADLTGDGLGDVIFVDFLYPESLVVVHNTLALDRPVLTCTDLVRGQPAEFTVTNLEPGDTVRYLYSLAGVGYSTGIANLGGLIVDLNEPLVKFGAADADASGTAVLPVTVPGKAPLITAAFQAVVRQGPGGDDSVKSNFLTVPIRDQ
ncbi:MAG: VCBS repeat-containing protein [Planctomycetes bacterium]|nr:VCBS repeat-containing protein [Planctomycetota bacterium]NOG55123.1 VCBS repeat-containing protein [Planctomycetota bacterium]